MENFSEAQALLKGAYDLHVHSAPSHFPRALNDLNLIKNADELGFGGVLIKSHYESTAGRAALINDSGLFKTRALGGLVLNHSAGGLNPHAAESALRLGAAIIWMPTRDAFHITSAGGSAGDFIHAEGIRATDENGRLRKEIYDLFDVVRGAGAVLATGHLSPSESVLLCEAGIEAGVTMLLTHPDWTRTRIDVDTQAVLARKGVIIEKCWNNVTENFTAAHTMASIEKIGPGHCILTTDRGQAGKELPHAAMTAFVGELLKLGMEEPSISHMIIENPNRIVSALKPLSN